MQAPREKRFLSAEVPLLVFYSRPNPEQCGPQRCPECVATETQDDDEACTVHVTSHACACPIDACYTCGVDSEQGIINPQQPPPCHNNNNNNNNTATTTATSTHTRRPLHLFITVCMHGNEQAGLVAINELIAEGALPGLLRQRPTATKLTVMVGNPRAVAVNKRFLEQNLNRIIHSTWFEREAELYEARRARLVARTALTSDQWLDLHTTSSPCTAHALPTGNPQSEELAEKLDVGMVISQLAHHTVQGGTSCDFALQHNKACVCVECGQEGTRESVEAAKRVIMSFIAGHRLSGEKRRYVSTNKVRVGKGFRYTRPIQAFEHVSHNELLAVDDEVGEIRCPFPTGALVIMPTSAPVVGEEAWFWGRQNLEIESV